MDVNRFFASFFEGVRQGQKTPPDRCAPRRPRAGKIGAGGPFPGAVRVQKNFQVSGRRTVISVPRPSVLSASMVPPHSSTMRLAMGRPRPFPAPEWAASP